MTARERTIRIDVVIDLTVVPDSASEAWRHDVTTTVIARALALIEDLDVKLLLEVAVKASPPSGSNQRAPFAVLVDDVPCRIDRGTPLAHPVQASDFGHCVGDTLYWNRDVLITASVPDQPQANLAAIAQLVRDGFSVPVAVDLVRAVTTGRKRDGVPAYELGALAARRFAKVMTVHLGGSLYDSLFASDSGGDGPPAPLREMMSLLRDGLFYELGMVFPDLEFEFAEDLGDRQFRGLFNMIRGPVHEGLPHGTILVNDTVERLALFNVTATSAVNPAFGQPAAIANAGEKDVLEREGSTTWDAAGHVVLTMSKDLRRHASMFMTVAQAESMLVRLDEAFPMPVFNALERYSLTDIRDLLKALVAENISVRDLRGILEALLEINGTMAAELADTVVITAPHVHLCVSAAGTPTGIERADYVRSVLRWQLMKQFEDRGGTKLVAFRLSPGIESRLARSAQERWSADEHQRLVAALAAELRTTHQPGRRSVIVTTAGLRRTVRELIDLEFPDVDVVTHETLADLGLTPFTQIDWT